MNSERETAMTDSPCVLIAAGGSGGHMYPAGAYARALAAARPQWRVILVTDERSGAFFAHKPDGIATVRTIGAQPFLGMKSLLSPSFWAGLFGSFSRSGRILKETGPHLVVGFGGYASFPVVAAAVWQRRKTVVHEQNRVPGLANRVLAFWVRKVAYSLPPARPLGGRGVIAGFPVREGLKRIGRHEAALKLGFHPDRRVLLVFGGSRGSRFLNRLCVELVRRHGEALADRWQVVLIRGTSGAGMDSADMGSRLRHKVLDYAQDMGLLYSAADLVLSRAGSSTLHELAVYGKGAVLVPYPGARGHQVENALWVSRRGGAQMVVEAQMHADRLLEILRKADACPEAFAARGRALSGILKTDGAQELVKLTVEMTGNEKTYCGVCRGTL